MVGLLVGLVFSFALIFRVVIRTHHSLRIISKGSVRFTLAAEWNTWVTRPALWSRFFKMKSKSHMKNIEKCSQRCHCVSRLSSALAACHALHLHEGATKISLRQISRHSLKQTQPNIAIIRNNKMKRAISWVLQRLILASRGLVAITDVKIWKQIKQKTICWWPTAWAFGIAYCFSLFFHVFIVSTL